MAVKAFDLAERFQTPVFVLSDLDIGMNDWMVPQLQWDDSYRPDRGKVLSAEELEQAKSFYRYLDVDGDGIPYRIAARRASRRARTSRAARATTSSAPTPRTPTSIRKCVDRIDRKIQSAARAVPAPVVRKAAAATKLGLLTHRRLPRRVHRGIDQLAKDGIALDYMRVRGFPFGDEVRQFSTQHDVDFVVEQNRDAQLRTC